MEKKKFGSKKDILLVNSVTASRFFASFLIIPIFKTLGGIYASLFSMIFLFTDFIDGQMARKLKASTFFGAAFDGLTDKIFGIICLLILMKINPLVFSIPLLLECGILFEQNKKRKKGLNIQSNMTGKIKTWFLSLSLIGSFLAVDLLNIPEFTTYIKNFSVDKIASIKQTLSLLSINLPTYIAQILTYKSYNKEINDVQTEEFAQNTPSLEIDENPTIKLEEIAIEKEQLRDELTNLEKMKILQEKLFDPEYYHQNKDVPIRKLTKELFEK